MEIRFGRAGDRPALTALWQLCFGEGEDFAELFFRHFPTEVHALVLEEAGGIHAALYVLPWQRRAADGAMTELAYLYGVCTHPEARGREMGRELLRGAERLLDRPLFLTPAEESLVDYYTQRGFAPCSRLRELPLPEAKPQGRAIPVPAAEYDALRRVLLTGRDALFPCLAALELQKAFCKAAGGDLYRLELPGAVAAAVAEGRGNGGILIRELLCPEEELILPAAALLREQLGGGETVLRLPPWQGATLGGLLRGFGSARPDLGAVYQGLALD